jgi:hypothetical protein
MCVDDAVLLLADNTENNYADFDDRIKRVIDVAWLLIEDKKDGVMSPSDDDMLDDALRNVLIMFGKN